MIEYFHESFILFQGKNRNRDSVREEKRQNLNHLEFAFCLISSLAESPDVIMGVK